MARFDGSTEGKGTFERRGPHLQTDKTNRDQAPFELVESREDLCRIAADLSKQDAIGVDLEADSMFHYREKVCLIQISAGSRNILIDPLAQGDLSPLAPVFCDHRVRKVFHGADYDTVSYTHLTLPTN